MPITFKLATGSDASSSGQHKPEFEYSHADKKQAEDALLKAGALQSAIFNSANFSSIATDAKGVIQIFNVGAERMLGYAATDVMNKITPADISDAQEIIARAQTLSVELDTPIAPGFEALVFKASRGIEDIYELTYIRKDGSRFPAVVSVTALRDDQNAIIGYLLIGTDNTARKQAEEALLKAGALQKAIFDSANFSSIATDAKGVIQIFNVGAERMLGYTAADVMNKITPADISDAQEVIARATSLSAEAGVNIAPGFEALVFKASRGIEDIYELTYIRKDGSRFPAVVSVTALRDDQNAIIGYLLIGTDNTARKQAEEALLKAGALQKAIFDSENFSSIATDAKGVIQIFNVGAERMLGYAAADVMNKITPADISDAQEVIARATSLSAEAGVNITPGFEALVFKASRGIEDIYELTYIRKDGSRFPAVVSVTALRDDQNAIIGYLLIGTDNTARKQAEEALLKAGALQKAIFDSANFSSIATDAKGVIQIFNVGAERMLGYAATDVMNKITPADISDPQEIIARAHALSVELDTPIAPGFEALVFKASRGIEDIYELTYIRKDGSRFPAVVSVTALRDDQSAIIGYLLIGTDNTARKLAEEALLKAGALQSAIFNSANFSSIATDAKGVIQIFNVGAERMLGYAAADVMNKITPADISDAQEVIARATSLSAEAGVNITPGFEALVFKASRGIEDIYELTYIRKDGSRFPAVVSVTALRDDQNAIIGYLLIGTDNTARKQGEEKLKLAASVFTHAREGILIADADSNIIDVNEAFCRITGFERYEVLGKDPSLLLSDRNADNFYQTLTDDLGGQGYWYGEIWNKHKSGHDYAVIQAITAVRDDRGETKQYVSLFSDITRLKEHQIELEQMAHFDSLTKLPNRVLLSDRLEQAIFQARRHAKTVAVVFLDLDGFKAVNDQHGHDVGDHLLVTLAQRMKHILREGDTLARIGGDEFVAVLLDLPSIESCEPMLMRLLSTIAQPVLFGKLYLQVSASLGVTFYPISEDVDADQLIRQADQAMYQAKLAGKNRFHVFDADLDRSLRGHHVSLERIRLALVQGEFELYYQPKVNMRTGAVFGVEALIRWNHPQKGLLSPGAFLPAIEDHPLAIEVGEWVIDTALHQMAQWQRDGLRMPVSVNVGARQLQQTDFVQRLEMILEGHPSVRPEDLELEVLETSALQDLDRASNAIRACQAIGVTCVLDDFGTGYSSLTYLRRLPVNKLKLDQTFVMGMLDDPDDMSILEGVIGLAAAFKRPLIAEGVETLEHGLMLLLLGCELAQGHCISRPMPAGKVPQWTETWVADWITSPIWGLQPKLNRADWPLLFVRYEQLSWHTKMMAHLNDELRERPEMDPLQSTLGRWLHGAGLARYQHLPAFLNTQLLHQGLFELASVSLALQREGQPAAALEKAEGLVAINSKISRELKLFFEKIQTDTAGQFA